MEHKELVVCQGLHEYLLITSPYQCSELPGKHCGIAAGNDYVRVVLKTVTPDRLLPAVDFLYLVNQDVIVPVRRETAADILIEIRIRPYAVKLLFLLIDIDDIRIVISAIPVDKIPENKAFSNPPLTRQNYNLMLSEPCIQLLSIILPSNNILFHNSQICTKIQIYFL